MSGSVAAGIQSMTGFGRSSHRGRDGSVSVEVRSTNHRYLEIEPRGPAAAAAFQGRLTQLIRAHVRRGRVELSVGVQSDPRDRRRIQIDEPLLGRYHAALQSLQRRFRLSGAVTLEQLLSLPHAVRVTEEQPETDQLWPALELAARQALQALVRSRRQEGAKLAADVRRQLMEMARHLRAIRARRPKAVAEQRKALRRRLLELLGSDGGSASRLEEAVALVREPDIHEELVRLDSHMAHVRQALAAGRLVGKQLDFIAQELMRETNTMGAKVNDSLAARHVIDMKGCIEKIREQVQNLE